MPTLAQTTKHSKIFSSTYWGCATYDNEEIENCPFTNLIINNRNQFIEFFKIKSIAKSFKNKDKFEYKYFNYKRLERNPQTLKEIKNDYNKFGFNSKTNSHGVFDHNEAYKTECGDIILITSPYSNDPIRQDILLKLGWSEYNKLYNTNAYTYYIKFNPKMPLEEIFKF